MKKGGIITEFETNSTSGKFRVKTGGKWRLVEDENILDLASHDEELQSRLRNMIAD